MKTCIDSVPSDPDVSIKEVSPTTISLLIRASGSGGQPIEAYKIVFYAEGDDQNKVSQLVPVNSTSKGMQTQFVINNLAPRRRYVISVEARNNVGYGAKAAIAAMTLAIREPNPPTVTSPRFSDYPNSYKLVWEKPGTGGMPLTRYMVRYYQVELSEGQPEKVKAAVGDMKTLLIDQSNVTEITLTELMPNCTYELQISAMNPIGVSKATRKIFTTPPGGSVPSDPDVLIKVVSPTTISLLIRASGTGGQPIEAYKIVFYAEGDDQNKVLQLVPVNSTSQGMQTQFVINNLLPSRRYVISVEARNNVGYGAKAAISAMTQSVQKPSAPSISADEVTSTSIRLLIAKEQETGGQPVIEYRVVYYAKGNVKGKIRRKVPVNRNSKDLQTVFLIDNLEAGVQYFIRVMARNNLGYGAKAKMSVKTAFFTVPSLPSLTFASRLVFFFTEAEAAKGLLESRCDNCVAPIQGQQVLMIPRSHEPRQNVLDVSPAAVNLFGHGVMNSLVFISV
ncbi:fibronectin type-III domain-containing protein 3A-like [Haliotis rubra]|uniref:fibronectin type-III domain-containing protein 3A-like n=1 Tax=Haliotis rubra TaxID=36100 RepID=UPI001EE56FC1|nr:fibronectin type-III domain-containing protein 3A-like [Haliotis rubra]